MDYERFLEDSIASCNDGTMLDLLEKVRDAYRQTEHVRDATLKYHILNPLTETAGEEMERVCNEQNLTAEYMELTTRMANIQPIKIENKCPKDIAKVFVDDFSTRMNDIRRQIVLNDKLLQHLAPESKKYVESANQYAKQYETECQRHLVCVQNLAHYLETI